MALEIGHDLDDRTGAPALPLRPLAAPTRLRDRADAEEVFRWARFLELDSGQTVQTVSRQRAVEALLDAADHDWDLLHTTRLYALKALRQGVATRDVLDLVQEALDALSG